MSLLPLFEWMEAVPMFDDSWQYVGPAFNLVHLLSMVVFVGAMLMVDLRLLGQVLPRRPVAQIAREAQPWLVGGFLMLVATGVPAMIATALGQYYNPVFWFKMYVLLAATVFTFTIRHTVARADEARVGAVWGKVVALLSIGLWATVAASARLIMLL